MQDRNRYCAALGIAVPSLEEAAKSPDANFYSLLIAALLEHGGPLTLAEVAERFARAGIAPADRALASLKRCKPARPPVYREADRYALDPHDDEADLWAFRLGLRPPRFSHPPTPRPEPAPLPPPEQPLTVPELDEMLRSGPPSGWSAQRSAISVLDAHSGAMHAREVMAFWTARAKWSPVNMESARYWRHGAPIRVRDDGLWELDPGHAAVRSAREAVRERLAAGRRSARPDLDPEVIAARTRQVDAERAAHARQLARMRRVIVHAFPESTPYAVTMLDVEQHRIMTLEGDDLARVKDLLQPFEIVIALRARALTAALGWETGERRLVELSPPQKSLTIDRRGRTLRITTEMLIQGSCGISRPLGERQRMQRYLDAGEFGKLRRRLEADVKSLLAYYEYGRLHHAVRLRWGFVDTMFRVAWAHRDEPSLGELMQSARVAGQQLEIVAGSAPGWEQPWARAELARVVKEVDGWRSWLVDADGDEIFADDVQRARLVPKPNPTA